MLSRSWQVFSSVFRQVHEHDAMRSYDVLTRGNTAKTQASRVAVQIWFGPHLGNFGCLVLLLPRLLSFFFFFSSTYGAHLRQVLKVSVP